MVNGQCAMCNVQCAMAVPTGDPTKRKEREKTEEISARLLTQAGFLQVLPSLRGLADMYRWVGTKVGWHFSTEQIKRQKHQLRATFNVECGQYLDANTQPPTHNLQHTTSILT